MEAKNVLVFNFSIVTSSNTDTMLPCDESFLKESDIELTKCEIDHFSGSEATFIASFALLAVLPLG